MKQNKNLSIDCYINCTYLVEAKIYSLLHSRGLQFLVTIDNPVTFKHAMTLSLTHTEGSLATR